MIDYLKSLKLTSWLMGIIAFLLAALKLVFSASQRKSAHIESLKARHNEEKAAHEQAIKRSEFEARQKERVGKFTDSDLDKLNNERGELDEKDNFTSITR